MTGLYDLVVNGKQVLHGAKFAGIRRGALHRLEFRTGSYRMEDRRETERKPLMDNGLPGADEELAPSVFCIDNVRIRPAP